MPSALKGHYPLDRITDVTALINVPYLEAKDGALVSRDFIGDALPQTEAKREALRALALAQPNYPDLFFSADSRYGYFG